jgi:hypothetical protein
VLARAALLALAAPLLTVLLAHAIGIEVPPGHEGHRHVHLATGDAPLETESEASSGEFPEGAFGLLAGVLPALLATALLLITSRRITQVTQRVSEWAPQAAHPPPRS